ncbi:type II toxin-antitoxin system VapB family antitoxin [Mongoliitalea lutea]|uniref:Antitoxin VapB n=1 Tax=Mongoliitalea lutea TaxID=849756 RepID=A0A8J3CWV1_9BACT|nr:type II toxin-antitoxin system VapB family antitoxin [Mongoliitalea lutea]GHB40824.1 antitoxin VapB [Mongoliitalea lutea]
MLTKIEIDENLIFKAMELTGLKTKEETIEEALKLIINLSLQKEIRDLKGKLKWEGDLETMRRDL